MSVLVIRAHALGAALSTLPYHLIYGAPSPCWGLRYHIAFNVIRAILRSTHSLTIEDFQRISGAEVKVHPNALIISVTISEQTADENIDIVKQAIRQLGDMTDLPPFDSSELLAEWIAPNVNSIDNKRATYEHVRNACTSSKVILYFQGGAYIVNSKGHRPMLRRISKYTNSRLISISYRLAPQKQFPHALLDALQAYDYLLHPPSGSLHDAVDPSDIYVAGDSAGGGLALALLLTLQTQSKYPLPGGLVLLSPWLDITHSWPSCQKPLATDYLHDVTNSIGRARISPAWPAGATSFSFYSDAPLHPLVSPVLGQISSNIPLLFIIGDGEYLRDENIWFAKQAIAKNKNIRLYSYESMSHVFPIFQHHLSDMAMEHIAAFVGNSSPKTKCCYIACNGTESEIIEDNTTSAEATARMNAVVHRRRAELSRLS